MRSTAAGRPRPMLCGLFCLLAACGAAEQPVSMDATASVRDSAGIRIVTNPDVPLPEWSVDTVPFLDIGTVDGAEGQDLGNPWAATGLPAGGVAISDYTVDQVRIYDAAGRHVRSVGGPGGGPGEFGTVAALHVGRGDSLVVSDVRRPRLTLFGPQGEPGRTIEMEQWEGQQLRLRGLLADTLAVYRAIFSGMSSLTSGTYRDSVVLVTKPLDGGAYTRIGGFPGGQTTMVVMENGMSYMGLVTPFAADFEAAVTADAIWAGAGDAYAIHVFGLDGALNSIVRVERPGRAVGDAERERYLAWNMERDTTAAWRQRQKDAEKHLTFPSTMPAYTDLRDDPLGRVWVREYAAPWEDGAVRWRIFDPEGQQLATADLPARILVLGMGSDYVLGRWQGEMGEWHVGKFRVHTGG